MFDSDSHNMPNLLLGMEFGSILQFLSKSTIFDDFVDFVGFMDGRELFFGRS